MAAKIGVVMALDGEAEFTAGLQKANAEVKRTQSELKSLDQQYSGSQNSLEALRAKQDALSEAQEKYNAKVEAARSGQDHANETLEKAKARYQELDTEMKSAQKTLEQMEKSGDNTSKAYQDQEKYVNQLNQAYEKQGVQVTKAETNVTNWGTKLNDANTQLEKNNQALNQNAQYLNEAENSVDHCATSIDQYGNEVGQATTVTTSWGDKIKQAFANAAATAGLQIARKAVRELVQAFKEMISVGSEFEAAMSNVSALSGATGSSLDSLTEKAKELGNSTKFTATEVADAFSYMSLAGWDTEQMLDGIDGVLQLAAASGMELADASDMVTDYLTAFNMEASEATTVADMLSYAQANSNTTTEQLGEAYKNCAANMNAAGQDIQTVTSLLEAMANQGYKGSQAGTALKAVMRDITNNMKDGAIAIGDTNVQVMDQEGNFRDLTDILTDVESACTGMGDAEQQVALSSTFTSRSLSAVNMVLNEGMDAVSGYEDALRNCDGAAQDMADTMQDNLQGDMTKMNSALEGLGIQIYEYFDGPLRSIVQGVTTILNDATDAITPQEDALKSLYSSASDTVKGLDDVAKSSDEVRQAGQEEATSIQALGAQILALNSNEELSALQKERMKDAVDQLSDSIPELSAAFDEETGHILLTDDAIQSLIDSSANLALVNAEQSALSEEGAALAEAELALGKAQVAQEALEQGEQFWSELEDYVQTAMDSIQETGSIEGIGDDIQAMMDVVEEGFKNGAISAEEYSDIMDRIANASSYEDLASIMYQVTNAEYDCWKGAQEGAEALEGLQEDVDAAQESYDSEKEAIEAVNEMYQENRDSASEEAEAQTKAAQAAQEETDSLTAEEEATLRVNNVVNTCRNGIDDLADAEEDAAEETDDLTDSMDAAEVAAQQEAAAAEAAAQRIQSAYTAAFDDVTAAYESVASEFANGIDLDFRTEFNGGDDSTVEEMMATAEANIQALQDYANNLELVSSHVGEEIAPEFMQYLESLGTEGANTLQHIAATFEEDDGPEKIAEWSDMYLQQLDIEEGINTTLTNDAFALEYGLGELGSTEVEWSGLQDSFNQAVEIAGGVTDDIQAQFQNAVSAAQEAGVAIPDGLSDGLANGEFTVEDATDQIYAAMLGRFDALAQLAEEQGFEVSDSLREGVESGADGAAEGINAIIDAFSGNIEDGSNVIESATSDTVGSGTQAGVEDAKGEAGDATSGITSEMGNTIAEGKDDLKEGTEEALTGVDEALEEKAEEVGEEAEQIDEEMGNGIESAEGEVESAIEDVTDSAIETVQGKEGEFQQAGQDDGQAYAQGLETATADAAASAQQLAQAAIQEVQGQAAEFTAAGEEDGVAFGEGISAGAEAAAASGTELVNAALDEATGQASEFESVGTESGENYASGIESEEGAAQSAAQGNADSANDALQSYVSQFQSSGQESGSAYAQGIQSQQGAAVSAAQSLAQGALNAVQSYVGQFTSVGVNISQGVASGISSGASAAISAAASMASQALAAAKAALDIASPSKKFKNDVGKMVGKGFAQGIDASSKDATASAESMSNNVYKTATAWLKKYKKSHDVSLADEKYFWKQMTKQCEVGTSGYNKAAAKMIKASVSWYDDEGNKKSAADYYSEIYSEAEDYLKKTETLHDMSVKEELDYWERIQKQLKKGTDAWYDAQDKINDLVKQQKSIDDDLLSNAKTTLSHIETMNGESIDLEIAYYENLLGQMTKYSDAWYELTDTINDLKDKYYDTMYNAANDYASQMDTLDQWSAQEQLAYWTAVQQEVKTGTDAWYNAQKQINSIRSKIGTVSNMNSLLTAYTTYYEMSEKAEMDYWNIVRMQYEEGTDERLEADQKYFDAKEKYNDDLIDLEEDYAQKMKDIDDQLASDIKSLTDQYTDAVDSRVKTLESAYNLFDEFTSSSATGQELLFNLQTQAAGYEAWSDALDELADRGILSDELLEELTEMGPEELAAIYALSDLTDEELTEYQEAFDRKMSAIQKQAEKENEDLLSDIEQQTAELNAQAELDKEELTAEYKSDYEALSADLSEEMTMLANKATEIADDQTTALVNAIQDGVDGIESVLETTNKSIAAAASTGSSVASSSTSSSGMSAEETNKILDLINAGTYRTSMTAKQRANHSDLHNYLVDNYNRGLTSAQEKKIAKELGVDTSKSNWKKTTLKELQKKGFRKGGKIGDDQYEWMDEDLSRLGPELVVSRSDNALLTRIPPHSDIIDANTTSNLLQLAKVDPNQLLAVVAEQQSAADAYLQEMSAMASLATLNDLISTNVGQSPIKISTAKMEEQIDDLTDLVNQCVTLLTDGQELYIDSDKLVGGTAEQMGIALAKRANRARR